MLVELSGCCCEAFLYVLNRETVDEPARCEAEERSLARIGWISMHRRSPMGTCSHLGLDGMAIVSVGTRQHEALPSRREDARFGPYGLRAPCEDGSRRSRNGSSADAEMRCVRGRSSVSAQRFEGAARSPHQEHALGCYFLWVLLGGFMQFGDTK